MKKYIIVGTGWAGQAIAEELIKKNGDGSLVGFIDDLTINSEVSVLGKSIPFLGKAEDITNISKSFNVKDIILAVSCDQSDEILKQIVKCQEVGVMIHEMPEIYSKIAKKMLIHHADQFWYLSKLTVCPNTFYDIVYSVINILLSTICFLTIFIPSFPFIVLAIKSSSRGPVFYLQERVGQNEKKFYVIKYRTMVENAETLGLKWTEKNDIRITKVGKFLRKFRLDELPQLINVLKREMNLIGPRPEASELVKTFEKKIPFYNSRHLVKPGITGWAQVNHENTCSVRGALEKLQYDLYWIKNRSIWIDIKIIFKSIKVMLTGFGAV